MGYFSSWDMGIAGHGARHAGHGQCFLLVLGSALLWEDGNSPTCVCGGRVWPSFVVFLGLGEKNQLLLAGVELDIWQRAPLYTVKPPEGQGQSRLQTGGREAGAANAKQKLPMFLPAHLLVQRSVELSVEELCFALMFSGIPSSTWWSELCADLPCLARTSPDAHKTCVLQLLKCVPRGFGWLWEV